MEKKDKHPSITFLKCLSSSSKYGRFEFQDRTSNQPLFIPLKDIDSISNIPEIQAGDEIFFSPISRMTGNLNPFEVLALWVHIPNSDKENNRINQFPLSPSCTVSFQNGIDLYWKIHKDPRVGLPEANEIEPYLKKIGDWFGISINRDEKLRLPNQESKITFNNKEYDLKDFDFLFKPEPQKEEVTQAEDIQSNPESDNPIEGPDPQVEDDNYKFNFSEGAFIISRSLSKSEVWFRDPIYLKAWIWIIEEANHKDKKQGDFVYHRGEFFTTYDEFRETLKFYRKHKLIKPSLKQSRVILDWFMDNEMIEKKPVKRHYNLTTASPSCPEVQGVRADPKESIKTESKGEVRAEVRAYIGFRIRVINFDTYQNLSNYKGRGKGRPQNEEEKDTKKERLDKRWGRGGAEVGHYTNNERSKKIGRSKEKETDPRVLEFINYWAETFKQETGKPYLPNYGKDGSLVKRMFQAGYSLEDIQSYAEIAFKDEQCKRRGLTIGIFSQELNRLIGLKEMNPIERIKREQRKGTG
jgi:hypothetical protein